MLNQQKLSGRAVSIPVGLAIGTLSSVMLTVLCSVLLAKFVDQGRLSWENIGYGIMVQTMIAAFIGAKVSYRKIKRQRLLVCMLTGLIYYGLLIAAAAIFFGGQYEGIGVTALLIIAGCGSASLLGFEKGNTGKHKIRKIRHC